MYVNCYNLKICIKKIESNIYIYDQKGGTEETERTKMNVMSTLHWLVCKT